MLSLITLILSLTPAHADFTTAQTAIHKMRDVSVLVRVPKQVCSKAAKKETELAAASQSVYQGALAEASAALSPKADLAALLTMAKTCTAECTCAIFVDLSEKFSDPVAAQQLAAAASPAAEKMTDGDFKACQHKLKLSCQSPAVREVLRAMTP